MRDIESTERRTSPRFNVRLPLSLSISGPEQPETLNATAVNISMNGVWCVVDKYLPLFDKILITFVLPEETDPSYNLISQCEGVVVRVEPEEEDQNQDEYNIALYFNSLSGAEKDLLQSIISTYA